MNEYAGIHQRGDGSVAVTRMAPIRRRLFGMPLPWTRPATVDELVRECDRLQSQAGHVAQDLPWFAYDIGSLPSRTATCTVCGEQHAIRNLWRSDGVTVWVDWSLRWHHAETRHLEQALAVERDLDRLALLGAVREQYRLWWLGLASEPPDSRLVARLTRPRLRLVVGGH